MTERDGEFENELEIMEDWRSPTIGELVKALASARLQFTAIKKTEKVAFSTTAGRRGYNYAPLDTVIDATKKGLSENGLAVIQILKLVNGNTILETILSHSSGEWIKSESYVGKQDQPPQSEGSALTYKRRYSLSAILNIASEEDDDAQSVEKKQPEGQQPKPEALPSKSKPPAEPLSGNLPVEEKKPASDEVHAGKTSPSDAVLLKKQLGILKSRGIKAWSTASLQSYLETLTGQKAESIMGAVNLLSPTQAAEFVERIKEAVEKSAPHQQKED